MILLLPPQNKESGYQTVAILRLQENMDAIGIKAVVILSAQTAGPGRDHFIGGGGLAKGHQRATWPCQRCLCARRLFSRVAAHAGRGLRKRSKRC
jgi:hypothetical protein